MLPSKVLFDGFSQNPWDNLDRGISPDSQLYVIGQDLYQLLLTLTIIGIVLGFFIVMILLFFPSKRRGESKERFTFYCLIAIGVCCIPGALMLIVRFASLFL